jgi:hypothetical protein
MILPLVDSMAGLRASQIDGVSALGTVSSGAMTVR